MKSVIFMVALVVLSFGAGAKQKEGCATETSLISYKAEGNKGHDFSLRNCPGGWVFANQAGEIVYIGKDNIPCVRNETTHQEKCGEDINPKPGVDTKENRDNKKASKFFYNKVSKELIVIALDDQGNEDRSIPQFRVEGQAPAAAVGTTSTRTASMDVYQQDPSKPLSNQGHISVERDVVGSAPANADGCNFQLGTQCQMVQDLAKKEFNFDPKKGGLLDENDKVITSNDTGTSQGPTSTHTTVTPAQGGIANR